MANKRKLDTRQRSNVRHFIYYLVNGTLDFDLLHKQLGVNYHDYLKTHPELFYKACCAFIDLECRHTPNWPDINHLGKMVAQWIESEKLNIVSEITAKEPKCQVNQSDFKEAFVAFSNRFSIGQNSNPFITDVNYADFIKEGATNVETCFAIWANVIEFENGMAINQEYAISRVEEYLKEYYGTGYQAQLEDWELELH